MVIMMKRWKYLVVLCVVAVLSLTGGTSAVKSSPPTLQQHPFVQLQSRACLDTKTQTNNNNNSSTFLQRLVGVSIFPRGGTFQYSKGLSIQFTKRKRQTHEFWWIFPLVVMITSYATFPAFGKAFHRLVVWISDDSWLPDNAEQMNLLSNVVTQVVNGPVCVSISVLFATLISVTISTLHSRQQDVQSTLINEVEALRSLEATLASPLYATSTTDVEKLALAESVAQLRMAVTTESKHQESRPQRHLNPHEYIALQSDQLLNLCDGIELDFIKSLSVRRRRTNPAPQQDPRPLLTVLRSLIQSVRAERKLRWIAVTSMHFPMAHYLTLALLVVSILVAFLVQTDESDFIFLHGLQVRVLWSILVTCFSSLAVVCADLSDAFSGVYAVVTSQNSSGTTEESTIEKQGSAIAWVI